MRRFAKLMMSHIFAQSFVLTFLAEWGDRSQISTIILAARDVRFDSFWVAETVLVFACCFCCRGYVSARDVQKTEIQFGFGFWKPNCPKIWHLFRLFSNRNRHSNKKWVKVTLLADKERVKMRPKRDRMWLYYLLVFVVSDVIHRRCNICCKLTTQLLHE